MIKPLTGAIQGLLVNLDTNLVIDRQTHRDDSVYSLLFSSFLTSKKIFFYFQKSYNY